MSEIPNNVKVESGNLHDIAPSNRGWVIGPFDELDGLLKVEGDFSRVEMKLSTHPAGELREAKPGYSPGRSIAVLVSGKIQHDFGQHGGIMRLERSGDYFAYEPVIPHEFRALEDSIVMTLRITAKSEISARSQIMRQQPQSL